MKFQIRRTSDSTARPISGAKYEFYTSEYIFPDGHKVNYDRIGYTVEYNSLEELIALHMLEGDLIITKSDMPDIRFCIEIYDDYRE